MGEEGGEEFEAEADFLGEGGAGGVVVGEVEQAFDGGLVDVGGQFGEALGAESADAFQRQGELRVIGHLFEGFEGDPVGAAEAEFGHAGLVPVVEDGVDEVGGDLGCGGGVHGGKVRRPGRGSRGKRCMYTKLRTDAVYAGEIFERRVVRRRVGIRGQPSAISHQGEEIQREGRAGLEGVAVGSRVGAVCGMA